MKIKAVLFDIDNTLFNTQVMAANSRRNAVKAMIEAGFDVDLGEALGVLSKIVRKYGPNYDNHYDRLLEEYGLAPNHRVIAAGIVAYHTTKIAYLVPYSDTIPTLLQLRENKIKLGVVSDGLAVKQWEKLIRLGLQHFFQAVVVSEDLGVSKPDGVLFSRAVEMLSLKPTQVLMVGDRLRKDIYGANKAGLVSVQILHEGSSKRKPKNQFEYPDYVIEKIGEILEILV